MKRRVCDAAVEVLRETKNDAVMTTDTYLCHAIAKRAAMQTNGIHPLTICKRVIDNIARQPGILVPLMTLGYRNRAVRIFRLPETIP